MMKRKKIKDWQRTYVIVITWLLASREPAIFDIFLYLNTSKELWEGIRNMYGQQNNHSHIYRLKQEIQEAKKSNWTNTEYVAALTKKLNKLKIYRPSTTDLIEIQKRANDDETYQYLSGLDSSFEALRSQLLVSSDFPSYATTINMVQREESRRLTMGGPQVSIDERRKTQVFIAKTQNPNSSNR